ncbi:hypothetical protein F0562_031786 [Nyssa sinensis]|uniref:Uncharacterized protein n=1 Tax=Nyssa sinensis TaxID=561372 RepID=A0A5J5AV03_9ASTE|nr:hypothetical protein F0562_031786 [Nyssa sinensis]
MRVAQYMLLHGELYYREPGGSLARCLGKEEAKLRLNQIHEKSCGDEDALLSKFVPTSSAPRLLLARDGKGSWGAPTHPRCQILFREDECCFVGELEEETPYYTSISFRPEIKIYASQRLIPNMHPEMRFDVESSTTGWVNEGNKDKTGRSEQEMLFIPILQEYPIWA